MRKYRVSITLTAVAVSIVAGGCALIHPTDPYLQLHPPGNCERPASLRVHDSAAPYDSLTLTGAIEIALANNPGIVAGAWEVERADAEQNAAGQAVASLRIEREKYELGRGAIVDVLDAQSALLDAQTNHYRALADLNVAQAQLKLATGSDQ